MTSKLLDNHEVPLTFGEMKASGDTFKEVGSGQYPVGDNFVTRFLYKSWAGVIGNQWDRKLSDISPDCDTTDIDVITRPSSFIRGITSKILDAAILYHTPEVDMSYSADGAQLERINVLRGLVAALRPAK